MFFDKFCPDLHGAGNDDGSNDGGGEGSADDSPQPLLSGPLVPPPPATAMAAACRWCSKELGDAPVIVLSEGEHDDEGGRVGGDGRKGNGGEEEGRAGGAGTARVSPRVLGLREFLREFVGGGEVGEELGRRGDLLRGVHLSSKVSALRLKCVVCRVF